MEVELQATGERVIEEHYKNNISDYLIYLFHINTYKFSQAHVYSKQVLDMGCGSGYGTHYLSQFSQSVVGVDIDENAIHYAKEKYSANNLTYKKISKVEDEKLPFQNESFDVVVSFQVIEHIENTPAYLSEISRVLKPGGVFLCATPDKSTRLFKFQKPWNMWHIKEYYDYELQSEIEQYFSNVDMFYMGGSEQVIDIELKRCNKIKWLTLPFTLPFIPDFLRVFCLRMLKKFSNQSQADKNTYDLNKISEEDVVIGKTIRSSVNLISVAYKLD